MLNFIELLNSFEDGALSPVFKSDIDQVRKWAVTLVVSKDPILQKEIPGICGTGTGKQVMEAINKFMIFLGMHAFRDQEDVYNKTVVMDGCKNIKKAIKPLWDSDYEQILMFTKLVERHRYADSSPKGIDDE